MRSALSSESPTRDADEDGRNARTRDVRGTRPWSERASGALQVIAVATEAPTVIAPAAPGEPGALLMLLQEGRCLLQQGDAQFTLEPGDLALVDLAMPVRRSTSGVCRDLRVPLPGAPLAGGAMLRAVAPPCLIDRRSGMATVLRAFVHALSEAGPLCEREQTGVRDALAQLAAAVRCSHRQTCSTDAPLSPADGARPREACTGMWTMLQRSIEAMLPDPALSPATLAAAHRISTRHLHRLFHQVGTSFTGYVRNRRLERCRDDLADPRLSRLPLTEIAYRWGFSDSSHFSRCFKAAFGCTAREFRARAACRLDSGQLAAVERLPAAHVGVFERGADGVSWPKRQVAFDRT